jgi:hypothetical protein
VTLTEFAHCANSVNVTEFYASARSLILCIFLGHYGPDQMTIQQARSRANRYRTAVRKGDTDVIRRDNLDPTSCEAVQ